MKRIICIILALLLLCPTAFAAEDLSFTFSDARGEVGDTVTIVASAKGAPLACSYKLVLVYDTAVLKPVEVKKMDAKGFFMSNLEATYEGKAAVNALAADATKSFEGDCDLFSVRFEILKAPEGGKSVIEIPYYECYDADLKMLDAAIMECAVNVGKAPAGGDEDQQNPPDEGGEDDGQDSQSPEDNTGNTDSGEENTGNTDSGEENTGNTDSGEENTGNGNASSSGAGNDPAGEDGNGDHNTAGGGSTGEEPSKQEDKTPTGQWDIFEQTEEITHSENGDINVYKGEFIRDKEDKLTDIKLFDEEGKQVGSLKVEEKEDGTVEVIEQDLSPAEEGEKPFNHLYWIIPLAVVLIAGAIAAVMILKSKKQEEENEE